MLPLGWRTTLASKIGGLCLQMATPVKELWIRRNWLSMQSNSPCVVCFAPSLCCRCPFRKGWRPGGRETFRVRERRI